MPAPRTPGRAPAGTARDGTAREALALRQQIALRQVLAARPDLSAEQAARLAAAAVVRGAGSSPARRRRPPATTSARRRTARSSRTPSGERAGRRWTTRTGALALSALLVPVAVALVVPGGQGAAERAGTADVTELALTAQSSLLAQADRYRRLEDQVTERRAAWEAAQSLVATVEAQIAAQQQQLGAVAADLYRTPPAQRYPLLGLDVHDPAATAVALDAQSLVERAERDREAAAARAAAAVQALEQARRQAAEAQDQVAGAQEQADDVLQQVRGQVQELGPEVTGRIAGLAAAPTAGPQQERNQAATRRWQDYLARLAGAGIEPPPAARLADPAALPPGFSPALDAQGQPVPGVAWAVIGNSPVTVLPAETVAAVSTALSQLGRPYVAGGRGPDTYDCGGFTSAAWLLAGYDVAATPEQQWATGAPVAPDALQLGDLVFSADGHDVGLYLGQGEVVTASASTYQVGVRDLPAGAHGVRVTLPAPDRSNEPLAGPSTTGPCGAPLPTPERVAAPAAWGGWSNGRIPAEALCALGVGGHALRCDAAASYRDLAAAFGAAFGTALCITDSYRSLGGQAAAFAAKPGLAAVPGTSNHGWALAVDLCGGINVAGTPQWTWMTQNAGRFGFVQPDWAAPGGGKPEPWHWEYGYLD